MSQVQNLQGNQELLVPLLQAAIQNIDVEAVTTLIQQGVDVHYIDPELGPWLSQIGDKLYDWWMAVEEGYITQKPLSEVEKATLLTTYLSIINALIAAGAPVHLWDCEEFYGSLWDAASAASVPVVRELLKMGVNPNSKDDEGLTIMASIVDLWTEAPYTEYDPEQLFPEQLQTLALLREYGGLFETVEDAQNSEDQPS